jgi:6-phosphofructokinase
MHVGILTGGGDCPGLNAVIRAVTLALLNECAARVTGIERGFLGLLTRSSRGLDAEAVSGILAQGGHTVICIAEGARARGEGLTVQSMLADSPDPLRLGGVGHLLQQRLQPLLQSEVRTTLLGHVQRGGSPTPFDRVLATRFGYHAAQLVKARQFGRMVALQGDTCTSVLIADVAGRTRTIETDHPLLQAVRGLGVSLGE